MTIRILAAAILCTLIPFNAYPCCSSCGKKKPQQHSECKKPSDKDDKTTDSESNK